MQVIPAGNATLVSCSNGRHHGLDAKDVEGPAQIVDERREAELSPDIVEALHQKGALVHPLLDATGRPGYSPADLLKLYIYGYLNRVRSSRRLEMESHRNIEVVWLLRSLKPDFKTIADFRRDNRAAFWSVFREFVLLCRRLDLYGRELLAVDGTRIKAVNNKDRNFTRNSLQDFIRAADERLDDYLRRLDDRGYFKIEDIEACEKAGLTPHVPKPQRGSSVRNVFFRKDEFQYDPDQDVYICPAGETLSPNHEGKSRDLKKIDYSNPAACPACPLRSRCTTDRRRVSRLNNKICERSNPEMCVMADSIAPNAAAKSA